MMRWLWVGVLVALGAVGADRPSPLAPCQLTRGEKIEYDWTAGIIRVRGRAPWDGGDDRGRAMARRAAVVDGYRSIGEAIQGVCVTTDFLIRDVAAGDKTVKTKLEAFVQGARVVDEWVEEGTPKEIVVLLEAPLLGAAGLSGAVLQQGEPAPVQPPVDPPDPITPVTIAVTGIVIDARPPVDRTDDFPLLTPALFPTVTDEMGAVLYGPELVAPEVLERLGGAHYYDVSLPAGADPGGTVDLGEAVARIGDQPLWLRAMTVGGATSMLYLPDDAAARLRELRDTPIVREGRVIILRRNVRPQDTPPEQPQAEAAE